MEDIKKILRGYMAFRDKYATGDQSVMKQLGDYGQKPYALVVSCCDSRVDPSLIFQCEPGDFFTIRNVANIIPPYEADEKHHGTSAALEFGICYLNVRHVIILGHSQCGGIQALMNKDKMEQNDFITKWVALIQDAGPHVNENQFAQQALLQSYANCLTFPWIKKRVDQGFLNIHLWYFDIKEGKVSTYSFPEKKFEDLVANFM